MVPVPLTQPGLVLRESEQGWSIPAPGPNPHPRPPSPGLLLHDVTMAGLQELRFPEEKPLLRGQDAAELVSRPVPSWGGGRPLVAKKEAACLSSMGAGGRATCQESSGQPEKPIPRLRSFPRQAEYPRD